MKTLTDVGTKIRGAYRTNKYSIFYYACSAIEIGLAYYFIVKFKELLVTLALFGLWGLLIFSIAWLFTTLLKKSLSKLKEKSRNNIIFIIVLVSILTSGLILKFSSPIIKPLVENVFTKNEKINPK